MQGGPAVTSGGQRVPLPQQRYGVGGMVAAQTHKGARADNEKMNTRNQLIVHCPGRIGSAPAGPQFFAERSRIMKKNRLE